MKNTAEKDKAGCTEKYNDEYWYNHPFFLKKDEQARASIAKYGFPAELLEIQAERMKK